MTSKYKKIFFCTLSIISIIGYGYFVYAAAPLGGYTAGQTLDPDCAPGDTDCVVAITSGGGVPAGSNGQVQYNNNGVFGADNLFTRDPSTFNTFIGKDTATPLYQYVVDLSYIFAGYTNMGTFVVGETVVGGTSGATAVIQYVGNVNFITSISGIFQDGETVTGQTSGATMAYNGNIGSIQPGDQIIIIDIGSASFKGLGTVISATSTQATIETTAIMEVDDYLATIVGGSFIDVANGVGTVVSQNQTGTINGSMSLSIGSSVDLLGGLFTGTGSVLSSKSSPDRTAQLFLGNSDMIGWNDAFLLSSIDSSTSLGASIFGTSNVFAGSSILQLGVGDVGGINSVPGFTVSLNRSDVDSDMTFETNVGRIGYFKNNGSVGLGYDSNPDGDNSFAIGYNVRSQSYGETALGLWNASSGPLSATAFDSFDRLLTVGNGTDSGFEHNAYTMWKDGSFAYNDTNFQNDNSGTEQNMFYFNYGNHDGLGSAQSKRAIRLGSAFDDEWDINNTNVGNKSISLGFVNDYDGFPTSIASGQNSITIGDANIASEQSAIAIGSAATADGVYSIAIGQGSHASGLTSTALGYGSLASGSKSVSLGDNAKAVSSNEVSLGMNNTVYAPISTGTWQGLDRLISIGNGDGSLVPTSDALTILKNGQTGIGIDNFETYSNGNIFQVGDGTTNVIGYVDDTTGNWVAVSDERKKDNITDLSYGLEQVLQLRPTSFNYKRNGEHTIGFIAQQVLPIIPESVYGSESEGYGMSYATLTPVLVKAIQEMNLKITDIDNTETPNTWRDALIGWFGSAANGIRKLFVGEVHTDTLCIGQTCVTESQLQQLLQNNQQVIIPSSSGNPPSDSNPTTTSDDTIVPSDTTEPIIDSNPVSDTGSNTTASGDTPTE